MSEIHTTTNLEEKRSVFLQRLKEETAGSHKALEQTALSRSLLSPSVSVAEYIAYLAAMRSVQAYTEEFIFPEVAAVIHDVDRRYKLALLDQDIKIVNHHPVQEIQAYAPEGAGMINAMAHMYVMEGSTLGGKFISKHIAAMLGLSPDHGLSYFNCYGEHSGTMWRQFLGQFSTWVITSDAEDQLINSANEVFRNIHTHFENFAA